MGEKTIKVSIPDSDEPKKRPDMAAIAAAAASASQSGDSPDKTTGLTGWGKLVTNVGVVGAFIAMFGWYLYRQDLAAEKTAERNDAREERQQKAFAEAIGQTNQQRREDTAAIVNELKNSHEEARGLREEMREVRRLLQVQTRTGMKIVPMPDIP